MIRSSAQGGKVVVRGERARTLALWSLGLVAVLVGALLVVAAPASAETFSNQTPIKIPATGYSGAASPYPSPINVSGMSGQITDVNVTLHRVGHTYPADIAVLLESPSGDTVILMHRNCGTVDIEDDYFTFDQQSAISMPQHDSCPDFVYRPNPAFATSAEWPYPAPPGPHGVSLNDFNYENPNGTWSLYVYDLGLLAEDDDVGDIEVGWTLTLGTFVDTTAPRVTSVAPQEDATGIAPGVNVRAFFSEAMRARSINNNTVKLFNTATQNQIEAVVSYDASTKKAVLDPSANLHLRRGVRYKAVVSSGAKDKAGNSLDQNQNPSDGNQPKVWFFTVT